MPAVTAPVPLELQAASGGGGRYDPHRAGDDDRDLGPAGATRASLRPLQSAQRHLDEALDLLSLLLDAIEQDADARAGQTRTALALTVENLHQARRLMDEQDLVAEATDGEEAEEEPPED